MVPGIDQEWCHRCDEVKESKVVEGKIHCNIQMLNIDAIHDKTGQRWIGNVLGKGSAEQHEINHLLLASLKQSCLFSRSLHNYVHKLQ